MRRRSFVVVGCGGVLGCFAGTSSTDAEPEAPAVPPPTAGSDPPPTASDPLEQHAETLRSNYADHGFTVVVQPPFVVAGDEAPDEVARRASGTVAWATRQLKSGFFAADPTELITIWLFRDEDSYRKWTWKLFSDRPDTPYGYYSAENSALCMNIATGGGTLVHEIVHPFIDANFPACPTWFDEGLASLYEQCGEREGRIVGFTNWRLPGLQAAIEHDTLPSFATLTATTRHEFYEEDPGTHYAQARYLCFYLQERKLLREYYRAFVGAVDDDPSGYQTLVRVLDADDMPEFERRWRRFVSELRFG